MASSEQVWEALKAVIDPDLGVSIVDLGLVYGVDISPEGVVKVTMTMTSPMCPMWPHISKDAQERVGKIEGVKSVETILTWEPAWTTERMSDELKIQFGHA